MKPILLNHRDKEYEPLHTSIRNLWILPLVLLSVLSVLVLYPNKASVVPDISGLASKQDFIELKTRYDYLLL